MANRSARFGKVALARLLLRRPRVLCIVPTHVLCACLCVALGLPPRSASAAGFFDAPSLHFARTSHSATLLASGEIVVVGGDPYAASAERYAPQAGTWRLAASPVVRRQSHEATLLVSGKLLITGGVDGTVLKSAELYDAGGDRWMPAAAMGTARASHTATLLPSGKVLVVGGEAGGSRLRSVEIYDPVANAWAPAAALSRARYGHTATLLPSGKVLVAGGYDGGYLKSVELYDPAVDSWTAAGALATERVRHTATLLPSGNVLVTGGFGDERDGSSGFLIASAELYDPVTNAWRPAGALSIARQDHTATLLATGKVLVVGGTGSDGTVAGVETYDPDTNDWNAVGDLATPRQRHRATLLPSGKVLVTGGSGDSGTWLAHTELYEPDTTTTVSVNSITPGATVVGQPYRVDFNVHGLPRAPTGRVTVDDGQGSTCGPVVLSNGTGSCSLPSTQAGGYVLTATYTPDSGAFAPSSATAHHAVNRAATTLAIVGHTPERTTPAQPVTVATTLAVVSPGAGTPSGPVTVGDGVDSCTIAPGGTQCALTLTTRGPRTLTASYAGDANYIDSSAQVAHHVNRLPVVADASYVTDEDSALSVPAAQGVLAQASDPDGDAMTVANAGTITASGIGGTVVLQADGGFAYTPPPYAHGTATFGYTVSDGFETVSATATITVSFVNHAPHFALAAVPKWPAGATGARTHEGFATVTDFGAPNEADQHVLAWHLRPLGDANGILSNAVIALDGTLSYTLSGRAGSATFGVRLQDDGGTANGGHDTSDEQTFTITVAAGLDLSISIGNDSEFVVGGAPVEYTIVVHNAGPNDAVGAKVRDLLPSNLVDAAWSCSATAGAACTPAGIGDIDDMVTVPSGASLTYRLIATVVADPEATVEQTVSVIPPDGVPDLDPTNNTATRRNTVGVFFDGFDRQLTPTAADAQAWQAPAQRGTLQLVARRSPGSRKGAVHAHGA